MRVKVEFQTEREGCEERSVADCGEDIFPLDALIEEDSLTAIARVYISDGFVVAADGREFDHRTERFRDDLQEIFHLHHQSGEIICSIAGYVRWENFDTGAQVVRIARSLFC